MVELGRMLVVILWNDFTNDCSQHVTFVFFAMGGDGVAIVPAFVEKRKEAVCKLCCKCVASTEWSEHRVS